ncbi:sensor histidine kinase [Caulobacter sp. BP25]|uniref:sensor histidine kinase n=1 Tax=Caulobacter sp. BP25 TaxID=2048900 RepID=UPI000C12D6F3|nr:HAMP domain-containing sensor histidine kinase [Caulobacter sp. BP25]PHY18856.1 two-component sensor histidine kinase [Caulobacter sp. BP25]
MVETVSPSETETAPPRKRFPWPGGLSARLLLFTAVVVAFGGLLILPPALASYEEQWLLDRVRAGELASTIAESDPELRVSDAVANQLFDQAGAVTVAVQVDGARRLVLPPKQPFETTPYLVDLRRQNPGSWLAAPFFTLTSPKGSMVRVMAEPRYRKAEFVEVVLPDAPLKAKLVGQLWQLAGVTLFVAGLAGVLVYAFLNIFLVRPMQRITRAMEAFRGDPDDPAARLVPSNRRDEIGRAELELDRMQADLLAALASKARLAALGEAVAKINHDLRNMLTSAQMASDRLAALGDPKVAQALPRLERALDRAITLASDVMAYGKSKEPAPVARPTPLRPALDMAAEDAGLSAQGVALETVVDPREQVLADPDQLHRILTNLLRNAREAIEGAPDRGGKGKVFVELRRVDGGSVLRLSDDGPGVPERARTNLFQPFVGSARRGGTGLGLAIARELAQGHGGDLILVETGPGGSVFDLTLAGVPEPLPEPGGRADTAAG